MLKQTVKNLTDKVLPGSKFSSDPTIASEALVDQIGTRTSILSGFAEKTSKTLSALSTTNTLRLEAAKEYAAENIDDKFGNEVRKQNPNIAEDKVEKEMLHILMQLHKLLDNHTREAFNNSIVYNKYKTYFDEYKENLDKSIVNNSTQNNSNAENKTYSSIRDAASDKILDKFLPEKSSVDIPNAPEEKKTNDLAEKTSVALEKILADTQTTVPEKTSVENLTVISEKTSVEIPEVTPEKTSEVTPEKTSVEIPEVTPEKTSVEIPEVTPEKTSVEIPEVTPEKTSVEIPEKKYSRIIDTNSEVNPEKSPEKNIYYSDSNGYFSDLPPEVTPEKTSVEIPEVTPEKTSVEIPEKKTYSSIREATSEKILDKFLPNKSSEEMPSKEPSFLSKVLGSFSKVTPEKSEETSIFSKVLGDVEPKDVNDRPAEDSNKPVVAELKKINRFLEEKLKIDKKNAALSLENLSELKKDRFDPSKKEINKHNEKVKPEKSGSVVDTLKDLAMGAGAGGLLGKAGGVLGKAGSVLATGARLAAPALLTTAAVGATGFAGYKAGQWLNENTGIQTGISDGIDSVKGLFGISDEDKMKEAEKQSAQVLYDKRVSEGKLTDKSAAFFEKQGIKVDKSKIVKLPTSVKSPIAAAVAANIETKDKAAASTGTASIQPIVLNNNSKSSPDSSGRQLISSMNVRNSETTFERVQMQDFWPRTA